MRSSFYFPFPNLIFEIMKKDECIEYINSVDYLIFSTDILHEAGKLHASVNQVYDGEAGLGYQYHLDLAVSFAKSGFSEMPWISKDEIKVITFATAFHDSIEDTRETYNDILNRARKYFDGDLSRKAADAVYAVTNEKGHNRAERANERYYQGRVSTPFAPYVKVCDRLANISYASTHGSKHMRDAYRAEMDHFIEVITSRQEWPFSVPQPLIQQLRQ